MPLVLDGSGGISGVDGTASNPAIEGTDSNTGIFYPAADTVAIGTGGTERLRVDSAGNAGLGATPNAWGASWKSMSFNTVGAVASTTGVTRLYHNAFNNDSNNLYRTTAAASMYSQDGAHQWFIAPSGTAGNAITFTQAMTLDASGRLGLGETNPACDLDISKASGDVITRYRNGTGTGIVGVRSDNAFTEVRAVSNHGIQFSTNNTERARITSGGEFVVGCTSSPFRFGISGSGGNSSADLTLDSNAGYSEIQSFNSKPLYINRQGNNVIINSTSGNLLVGTTNDNPTGNNVAGFAVASNGLTRITVDGSDVLRINRKTNDGTLQEFRQEGVTEGTISVSGTTVSYNGGHLSRYAQTQTAKDESLLKGTVLSNLDEMNVYTDADGNPVENEQLNKVKISDVEGDANVAGVFVNWSYDEQHQVDEINMAMTGDMIIRIAQGVTVQKGDLLMSAGDGTAKPQGDDVVRSKTVAKVTSNHVTCTYEDGSYCVPCVLMAC